MPRTLEPPHRGADRAAATRSCRGTSCTSCRCRRGRDRCGPPFRRSAAAWAGSHRRLPNGLPPPARAASCAGTPSPARRWWSKAAACGIAISRGAASRVERLRGAGHRRRLGNHAVRARRRIHRLAVRSQNLHPEQEPDRVLLELQHHRLEHVEGFTLVFHQRIPLRVAAQADALPSGGPSRADGPSTARRSRSASPCARDSAWSARPESFPWPRTPPSACRRSPRPARAGSAPAA